MRRFALMIALSFALTVVSGLLAQDKTDKADKADKAKDKANDLATKMFERLDTNGDGKISKEEFAKALEQRVGMRGLGDKVGQLVDRLFTRLDSDKDGYLTKEEVAKFREGGKGTFKEMIPEDLKEKIKEKLKGRFRKADR
ncbi:MAG: EF-hand domain-containing protein [Gemmataceae bacterium]